MTAPRRSPRSVAALTLEAARHEQGAATTRGEASRIRHLRALFDEALQVPRDERAAWMATVRAHDASVHAELEALLRLADTDLVTAHPGTFGDAMTDAAAPDVELTAGAHIGPYRVVRRIGEGGMGVVLEAERDDAQYTKRVAIKLVRAGRRGDDMGARFRRERQILARLEHRNIATLLDGGVTEAGQPYLVMEYVDGAPLTTWCRERRAPLALRLQLFEQVCRAVQHAHGALVLHRDLKPGNILVTADGTVKLLDFGIATLLDDPDGQTLTATDQRAWTPAYASPEHVLGAPLGTAADVYALGLVLFELCTGRRPGARLDDPWQEIVDRLDDAPAPLASRTLDAAVLTAAGLPDERTVRATLRGDLDAILTRALARRPDARYDSVDRLREDLVRWRTGFAVRARAGHWRYRLGKFARRHRTAVAAGALACVVAGAAGVLAWRQARATRDAQRTAQEVSTFVQSMLASVRPAVNGREVTVPELLDAASRRVGTELADQPAVRASLERVLAQSYQGLGRYADAEAHLRVALTLATQLHGARSVAVARVLNDLVAARRAAGNVAGADSLLRDALTVLDALPTTRDRAADSVRWALVSHRGSLANDEGRPADAERLHGEALALARATFGATSDEAAQSLGNLGVALGQQSRWADAVAMHREAAAIITRNHPGDHVQTAEALNALATALDIAQQPAEADSVYQRTLAMRARLYGTEHPEYAFTRFNYAFFLQNTGRWREAVQIGRDLLALRGRTIPADHPAVAAALQIVGRCLDQLGDRAEGGRYLRESLAERRRTLPAGHFLIASSLSVLADHERLVQAYAASERLHLEALALFDAGVGPTNTRTLEAVKRLVQLYDEMGRTADAARWRARLTANAG